MTSPQPPAPAPPAPGPPQPAPPAPAPPAPAPNGGPTAEDLARLQTALDEERKRAKKLEGDLAKAQQGQMSEQERLLAEAKAAGKQEAEQAAALRLASVEFRARAKGRIADPEAALKFIDLGKLLDTKGEPDLTAIDALVEQLAAVPPPPPPPGHIPAGPRQDTPPVAEQDFIRQIRRR